MGIKFNSPSKQTIQLLMQLEEHLPEMDDAQLKKYRRLCLNLSIEPKPLQCIKSLNKPLSKPTSAVKKKTRDKTRYKLNYDLLGKGETWIK